MVNEKFIIENKKPVEAVCEIKDEYQVPSFEEFMKTYESDENLNYDDLNGGDLGEVKGYGPCKNSLCGCSCSSYTCNCSSSSVRIKSTGTGVSASGRARGGNASGQVGYDAFSVKDSDGEARFISSTAGGSVGKDGVNARLGVDLANVKSGGVQARVGVNVDTGVSTDDDSLGVKVAGFGVSVGKQTGISTPFGEVKVDTDDCVIQ